MKSIHKLMVTGIVKTELKRVHTAENKEPPKPGVLSGIAVSPLAVLQCHILKQLTCVCRMLALYYNQYFNPGNFKLSNI